MRYNLFIFLLLFTYAAIAQKPPIDTGTVKKWISVGEGIINDDGRYACYTINTPTPGNSQLIIKSINNNWQEIVTGASSPVFTRDGKQVIFRKGRDSICLLSLGKEEMVSIGSVREYKLAESDSGRWLIYRLKGKERALIVRDLNTGKEESISSINEYAFNDDCREWLMGEEVDEEGSAVSSLKLGNSPGGPFKRIWSGADEHAGNYAFSPDGRKVAFVVESKKGDKTHYALWYYEKGMDTANMLANGASAGIDKGLTLVSQKPTFSKDGRYIFFGLQATEKPKVSSDVVSVDIWSYTDPELQSVQLERAQYGAVLQAAIGLERKNIVRLEGMNEKVAGYGKDWVLVRRELGNDGPFESYWNTSAELSFRLVFMQDGTRRLVKEDISNAGLGMSPGGNWIIYYDFGQKNYFSYNIATGVTRDITNGSPGRWADERPGESASLATWLHDDKAVLVYDEYDIWLLDPTGLKPAVNLTNGYGRKHHIKFTLLEEGSRIQGLSVEEHPTLFLKAVDKINKDWGFYSMKLATAEDPTRLFMGPYVFGRWGGYDSYSEPPQKARNANCYLVLKMSTVDAPNYFVTRDFKRFFSLSDVQPQKDYNWMTTELLHWRTFDGRLSAGILYKPENFDRNKKYPVIFDYYDKRSDELNLYITPQAAENRINIPWFVSRGYLVFTPDIQYGAGGPGQGAYNSIVSAAKYLAGFSWIDAHRMGIQGHSFGGYETDYLVTHTPIFAAACAASGFCDLIGWYGSAARGGFPMYWAEEGQGRLGATPWQDPEKYILNSPIFKADQVVTPLLMMQNKGDGVVPFSQGLEFFTALRRLGKKVWMLQYDGGDHSVDREAADDFTIRMTQFFDHYLKGQPAPRWMTRGIPASQKGIDSGFELDSLIKTPGPGLNYPQPEIK